MVTVTVNPAGLVVTLMSSVDCRVRTARVQEFTPIRGSLPRLHATQPALQFDLPLVGMGVSAVGLRLAGADAVLALIRSPAALLRRGTVAGIPRSWRHRIPEHTSFRGARRTGRRSSVLCTILAGSRHMLIGTGA